MSLLLLEIKKADFEIFGCPMGNLRIEPVLGSWVIAACTLCSVYSLFLALSRAQDTGIVCHLTALPSLLSCTWSCPFLQVLFTQTQHY